MIEALFWLNVMAVAVTALADLITGKGAIRGMLADVWRATVDGWVLIAILGAALVVVILILWPVNLAIMLRK